MMAAATQLAGMTPGLVINLCNTTRYYNPADLGVPYHHLPIKGHSILNKKTALEFLRICNQHFDTQSTPIVVHCTHGLNRTGCMIVTVLCARLGLSRDAAVALFAQARPPGIQHLNFYV